jgi:replicative DNA helicase
MVTPDPDRPVLYLALDRPRQIQRSMARMVTEKQRRQLHDGMIFHNGPLDFRVADKPQELLRYAQQVGAGTVVIDSLKDIASDLSNEGVTGEINKALQYLVADGIEVVTVHHPRKLQQAASQARQTEPRAPTLDDVYGSIWITAGHGSVLFLSGQAGDRVVEMTHVKQPSDIVGPLRIHHDHVMGVSSVSPSLSEIIATAPEPMFVADIARMSCGRKPSRAETEKVRRHFESLDGTDLTSIPGSGRTAPTQWYRAQRQHLREAA